MLLMLNEVEARVLAALVEKQLTTPEYYPLTLNALVQACNQKTNREPVVNYDETVVGEAINILREKNLIYLFHGSGSRTVKYKHLLPEVYELNYAETAVLAVLMLRGAQTVGELRERAGRMYDFSSLTEVEETLNGLMGRESNPLAVKLPRQLGQKDSRYAHLLSGEPTVAAVEPASVRSSESTNRIGLLEQKVADLTAEVSDLRRMFEEFRKQFE